MVINTSWKDVVKNLLLILLVILPLKLYAAEALMLYGGVNHRQFLGCLNCSKFDSTSICNKFGENGSKFASKSIWNKFGDFGSKFSNYSPWNKFSNNAPIIVDGNGGSYGYFSSNKFHNNRTSYNPLLSLLDFVAENDDLETARDTYCGD